MENAGEILERLEAYGKCRVILDKLAPLPRPRSHATVTLITRMVKELCDVAAILDGQGITIHEANTFLKTSGLYQRIWEETGDRSFMPAITGDENQNKD